jgi:hypothetical protein
MIASRRASEITFYEELGVSSDASPEQIREAFRALVRLLHPDQQTDLQLKDTAEKQMRKLNRIYDTLSDPEKRRQYDDELVEDYGPPAIPGPQFQPALTKTLVRAAWIVALVMGVALVIWLTADSAPAPQASTVDQPLPAPAGTPALAPKAAPRGDQDSVIAGLRADLKAVIVERDAAVHELARLRGNQAAPPPPGPPGTDSAEIRPPAITMTELPSAAKLPVLSASNNSLPRMELPATRKLAGFWFYAKPSLGQRNKNQALYPPQFIEITINEESGMTSGRVRARFEVADRPISPDVNFTFTGPSTPGPQASFPWTGSAGARGDLTFKFISENSVKFDWTATDLGTQLGLEGGTAVLTRRIE